MVWGGIGLNQWGLWCFRILVQAGVLESQLSATLTKSSDPTSWYFFARHRHHALLQNDARPHTARVIRDFLQQHNIQFMP
ncbi:hypothetical protein LOTGIDRAFT_225089 [Lottia gigantea]|uniref:Tc1-like transposase DDE domain-containing protein n=1 Tax=Lottia gigantea TaxID=225164 RepID=V4AWM8_LOTGI|nr:hypothetical protein LOTGIDRAFT_225089 [Lottia gigantea]ESP01878.1 hypothetical protein LOTGIDRAFT_225089 [Lottia gigantea]